MNATLTNSLKRIERLITKPAESLEEPEERQAEFQRRLERTRRLLAGLGNPQDTMDTIHIGGTSGKGSVAILAESMLVELGLHTGTHTSPYLQTPLEKARVDTALISADDAVKLSDRVLKVVDAIHDSAPELGGVHYAEAWLGLALSHFAQRACEAGVVEVGMGGRFDATNIIMPRVSVISTVHYDHTRVLGETLAEIAYHKAGIIKAGVPVVVGDVPDEAWQVIEGEAKQRGARIVKLGRDITCTTVELNSRGGMFHYHGTDLHLENVQIGMLGQHQFNNASVALAALEQFAVATGLELDEDAIRRGLAKGRFAGRMELVSTAPTVMLDGAHNQEKISALVTALRSIFAGRRIILVIGMLEAKTVDPIVAMLAEIASDIVTTQPSVKGKPAIPADELAHVARTAGAKNVISNADPIGALEQALAMAAPDDLVVVTGSLYLIGMVRSFWHATEKITTQRMMFPNGKI